MSTALNRIQNGTPDAIEHLAVVVIGRNEGERLRRCLDSVLGKAARVLYVDSGSVDGSAVLAREKGAETVELDPTTPFTAARARNAGWRRLAKERPDLDYVQFVDGNCQMADGWLQTACQTLDADPRLAVVCGRVRELRPQASLYNRLCDMEWDMPAGETTYCGGIAMMRFEALRDAGGFDESLIAGEEPELCFRLRQAGHAIWRLDAEMVRHDAAMTRFSQWWKRAVRCGYAFAEGATMHGASPERYCVRETTSIMRWAVWLPLFILILAPFTGGWSLLGLLAYPTLAWKTGRSQRKRGYSRRLAALYGASCAAAKFPQLAGMIQYYRTRRAGKRATLIEYK